MNVPPTNAFVIVVDGDVKDALYRLKHLLQKGGWYRELKQHQEYTKPGERRRLKSHRARTRARKIELRRSSTRAGRPRTWAPPAASPPAAASAA